MGISGFRFRICGMGRKDGEFGIDEEGISLPASLILMVLLDVQRFRIRGR